MLDKVALGSRIQVKIVKQPTNVAAKKTLVRLLSKDPVVRANNNRLRRIRLANYVPHRRGGRWFGGQKVKLHTLHGDMGEAGTITATCDVITDLRSVQRFISVAAAKSK